MNYDTINGTYTNGTVVLDHPVDWPDGMGVRVQRESRTGDGATDYCVNGSVWQDAPEAVEHWVQWFESLKPVFVGEELNRFEADLQMLRAEQKAFLPQWAGKISQLTR